MRSSVATLTAEENRFPNDARVYIRYFHTAGIVSFHEERAALDVVSSDFNFHTMVTCDG